MLILSRSTWPRRTAAVLALLVVAGCSSNDEPTAAEAGQTLNAHVNRLLKEINAQDIKITDPGGKDVPCGNGKIKRTFAATGSDVASERNSYILRNTMLGAVDSIARYEIVGVPDGNKPIRVQDSSDKTILVLDSPAKGIYVISGETSCLPAS